MAVRASRPLRRSAPAVVAALASALAGCGSAAVAELPPPAGPRVAPPLEVAPAGRVVAGDAAASRPVSRRVPVAGGAQLAVVRPRERDVELFDARTGRRVGRADAGTGPTNAVSHNRWLWVTDTQGDALLVFQTRPKLELVRRYGLPGGPYAIALDKRTYRFWVTLTGTNEVVEFPAHGRPHALRRLPTLRQPDAITVDPVTGRLTISNPDGEQQLVDPEALPG